MISILFQMYLATATSYILFPHWFIVDLFVANSDQLSDKLLVFPQSHSLSARNKLAKPQVDSFNTRAGGPLESVEDPLPMRAAMGYPTPDSERPNNPLQGLVCKGCWV